MFLRTPQDFWEMACSSSGFRLPAPGMLRSITYLGMAGILQQLIEREPAPGATLSRENSTGNRVESKGTRRIESGAPPPHRTQKQRWLGTPELSARLQSKPRRGWGVRLRHVHLALAAFFRFGLHVLPPHQAISCQTAGNICPDELFEEKAMAKIAKTADRKKMMDTTKSTDCPKCGKPTRI